MHMQEKHAFKYPWKVLSQVSLRLRDGSPRILKARSGMKLQNDQLISRDDEELSLLRTEHQPRMLLNFQINRTQTKKSTGEDEKSILAESPGENHSSTPTALKGCLLKGGIEKDKTKKKKNVTFKEEGSLCEVTYFPQNIDHPFRGKECKDCDFICASTKVLERHMKSIHDEVWEFQSNHNEDPWEKMQFVIFHLIVAVFVALCTRSMFSAIE